MDLTTLFKLSYGVYIVSAKSGNRLNGCIVNSVFQVTSENPIIAISISKQNFTTEFINDSKFFSIAILEQDTPMEFIGKFGFKSGRDIDKFKDTNYREGTNGVPIILDHSIAFIEVEVINSIDVETHKLITGRIINCETLADKKPLTYAYYHLVKGGKSPKNAPTFNNQKQEINLKKIGGNMKEQNYVCDVCGYVYDPKVGDPDNGIEPGTTFEQLPDDWTCPLCGVGKENFSEED